MEFDIAGIQSINVRQVLPTECIAVPQDNTSNVGMDRMVCPLRDMDKYCVDESMGSSHKRAWPDESSSNVANVCCRGIDSRQTKMEYTCHETCPEGGLRSHLDRGSLGLRGRLYSLHATYIKTCHKVRPWQYPEVESSGQIWGNARTCTQTCKRQKSVDGSDPGRLTL